MRQAGHTRVQLNRRLAGKRIIATILCIAMLLACAACGRSSGAAAGAAGAAAGAPSNAIRLYYLSNDLSSVLPVDYVPKASEPQQLCEEVSQQLAAVPESVEGVAPISGFAVSEITMENGVVTLDVSKEYEMIDSTTEILARAAIVNSLCQLENVTGVQFLVEGEPLLDSNGEEVGEMNSDMYIFNTGREIRTYQMVRLHLYFADETGTQLVNTYRRVVYNSNLSMERLVTEQVIMGTSSDFAHPTLNPETRVLSVTTVDGICYVSLNAAFLTEPYNVSPRVAIWSLVNSLCTLPDIDGVQISIDGDTSYSFLETVPLKNPLTPDESLIAE